MQIFDKLVEIRKDKKITIKKMANKFNKLPETLSKYEKNIVPVPGIIVESYADYLGFEIKLQLK